MKQARRTWHTALIVCGFFLIAAAAAVSVRAAASHHLFDDDRVALKTELNQSDISAGVAQFYQSRRYEPLWSVEVARAWPLPPKAFLRPEAAQFVHVQDRAGSAPHRLLAHLVRQAEDGDPAKLARAELALSEALAQYTAAFGQSSRSPGLAFVDQALLPPADTRRILEQAAKAPSLSQHLAALDEVNPVYGLLANAAAAFRSAWLILPDQQVPDGPTLDLASNGDRVGLLRKRLGMAASSAPTSSYDKAVERAVRRFQSAHGLVANGEVDRPTLTALNLGERYYDHLIDQNLDRARRLPPLLTRRFILVDIAAQQLWLYDNGKVEGVMRVVIGSLRNPTPEMAGVVRSVVMRPFWNIPVDLVRDALAPKVMKLGPAYLQTRHMQVLSDWTDNAVEVDPRGIDWASVAAGRVELRVRQKPGDDNMMGTAKFMFPNELGIYLHDTPNKTDFGLPDRSLSSGCIRVEQPERLEDWLLGSDRLHASAAGPNTVAPLKQPTPILITYLTAAPTPQGVAFFPDLYGLDPQAKRPALRSARLS